jgi:hypothetical protein
VSDNDFSWAELLAVERTLRSKLTGPSLPARDWQDWWRVVERIWFMYAEMTRDGITPQPPPTALAVDMGLFAGYLGVGTLPGPIADALQKGRHQPGPRERRDIDTAVAYHRAATVGLQTEAGTIQIVDKQPATTISKEYRVDKSTVHGWCRRARFTVHDLGNLTAERLIKEMQLAARRYRESGRSSAAILHRAQRGRK